MDASSGQRRAVGKSIGCLTGSGSAVAAAAAYVIRRSCGSSQAKQPTAVGLRCVQLGGRSERLRVGSRAVPAPRNQSQPASQPTSCCCQEAERSPPLACGAAAAAAAAALERGFT